MSKMNLIPEKRFPEFNKEWNLKELEQCLDYLQPTPYLVESTDYKDEYDTPVLTAGKSFILGYTNEKEGIFQGNLPVIIFDDFTTATQFVDFPFKTKSSAMKILLSKNGNDIKFVYEAIQMINYEVGVHQRHWISIFSKLKIPTPSPQEQQKIASCLSSLDEVIAAHSQKLELLQDHKKGLLQNLFPQEGEKVPKVRFKEFEQDGAWVEKKLGELLDFKNGINASKEQYGSGIKFINVLDILNNQFIMYDNIIGKVDVDEEVVEKNSVTYGDILFQRSSETQEEVGTANVYLDKERRATFGGFVIRGKRIGDYDPMFLNALLKTSEVRKSIFTKAGGSTRFNVGQETLSSTIIYLPSLPEQQKIATCLSAVDELITAQQEKIAQLQQHKKGLMQGLFPKMDD